VVRSQEVPNGRQEKRRACGYEAEKEYDNERMLVMHEVIAQAGAAVRDAAIGKGEVELSERRGNVDEEEAVKEADRGVPAGVSVTFVGLRNIDT
jgi:hypothetical protein